MKKPVIIATAALPYANGDIHIGHLVEYLQADFWTRFQRLRGNECLFFCADDTHGTPIMIRARRDGITPEELIAESRKQHMADFADFEIAFDNYSSTHSEINRELSSFLFKQMNDNGHIITRSVEQNYCLNDKMFLPDRFVKGICPNCGSEDQYSDGCEKCNASYAPSDLVDPYCILCNTTPVTRTSEHLFFRLNDFKDFLREWLPEHTTREVSNQLLEWFGDDLKDWDISRDEPYFGFEIPGHPGKYFYVWLDAPVGYMASAKEWCAENNRSFEKLWNSPANRLYHFIGKDIARFHCLFWPAILQDAGFKTPDRVFVHGFLTVNGEKMSKSKGTFISARTYLNHIDPMYLRFYYACKLNASSDDIDLSFADFTARVNSDFFGKITNLASRGIQMLNRHFDGRTGKMDEEGRKLAEKTRAESEKIAGLFENRDFGKGLVRIRDLADEANRYFDRSAPWKTVKTQPESAHAVLSSILNVFRILAVYLKPILPKYVEKVENLLNEKPYSWESSTKFLDEGHSVNNYEYLASPLEDSKLEKIMEETKSAPESSPAKHNNANANDEITIDDFSKIDLRAAVVIEASAIEGADKLLRLQLDLGDHQREVMAGIKASYNPEDLKGRMVICVANLKPRKMKFGVSQGMVLAAGSGGKEIFLLSPDSGAKPGDRVS